MPQCRGALSAAHQVTARQEHDTHLLVQANLTHALLSDLAVLCGKLVYFTCTQQEGIFGVRVFYSKSQSYLLTVAGAEHLVQ